MVDRSRRNALKGCAAAASTLLLASCSGERSASFTQPNVRGPGLLERDALTPLERQYGVGPSGRTAASGDQYVKLRPDVHVVTQGPTAIRAAAPSGLTWTLDPKVTGPIEIGRVLLVTNRCAGRVLATRPAGDQVEVLLGPAELSDYIDEAKIALRQPIDFGAGTIYEAPDYPGAVTRVGGGGAPAPTAWRESAPHLAHASFARDSWNDGLVRVDGDVEADPRFSVTPFFDPTTLGVQIRSLNDVMNMVGDVRLRFSRPELHFDLSMGGSKVLAAAVTLSGAAALLVTFRAHSNRGVNGNVRTRHFVPVDWCLPIGGFAVPFAATMRHVFMLQTAFSSKGNVDAQGQYGMQGALRMGFGGGGFELAAPGGFEVQRSLAKSVSGTTFGPAGLILTHQLRAIVGVGAFGFVTGPYAAVTSTASVTKGSSAGMLAEQCRETMLRMTMHGGIGYSIPRSVAGAINTVLGLFHVKGIEAEGGFHSPDLPIVSRAEHFPDLKACRTDASA